MPAAAASSGFLGISAPISEAPPCSADLASDAELHRVLEAHTPAVFETTEGAARRKASLERLRGYVRDWSLWLVRFSCPCSFLLFYLVLPDGGLVGGVCVCAELSIGVEKPPYNTTDFAAGWCATNRCPRM